MLIPGAAVAEVTGSLPPMPGPDEPGPFSLAAAAGTPVIDGRVGE